MTPPRPRASFGRRLVVGLLVLVSIGLLAYSGARAVRLSFTHDESNTFDLLEGNLHWKTLAAHHPLNTLLMRGMREWFGPTEASLRFPNVVAHALYLVTGLLLLRKTRHPAAMALGFAICNLNPFLLDFFGLARGYGLALGLSMAALWLLALARERAGLPGRALLLFASLACASLADLGNYTWLNLHLPLLGAAVVVLLVDGERFAWRLDRATLAATIALVVANGIFIRNLVVRIRALQAAGQLYARGEIGFLPDTVGSSLTCYFYDIVYPAGVARAAFLLVVIGVPALIFAMANRVRRTRHVSFASLLALTTAVAIAVPIFEHLLLKAPYPNERIALYYFPLLGVFATAAFDELLGSARRGARAPLRGLALLLTALMGAHFAKTANLGHTLTWRYDARTKDAMREIERYYRERGPSGQVRVGNAWIFQPSMDYYRKTLRFEWLAPIRRDDPLRPVHDLLYVRTWDFPGGLPGYRTLREFPETGSLILVREAGERD